MPAKITVKNNGSIRVEGDFELYDGNGVRYELEPGRHVSLCRCGESTNKPFCDGSHARCAFESIVAAPTKKLGAKS